MDDNKSKLSPGARFRLQLARTPRPQSDHNGRPLTKMTYTYDDAGMLIEAKATDEETES